MKQKHPIIFITLFVIGLLAHPVFAGDGFVPLFDGKTLDDWFTTRSTDSFSVNKEEKAIHTYAGKEHGSEQLPDCLVTKKQYSHYILRLEYKWLENRFSPRIDWDRDAGVLFHIHGNLEKTWPNSIEMQVGETPGHVTGASKDYWKGRKPRRFHTGDLFLIQKDLVQAQYLRNGIWWDPNGECYTGGKPGWARLGTEKPKGEWNALEIRVLGNQKATFILNGEVVFEIMHIQKMEGNELVPLTKGHIGLQAEWAELLYRNIRIKELDPPMTVF
jgi:beta-xylosidase